MRERRQGKGSTDGRPAQAGTPAGPAEAAEPSRPAGEATRPDAGPGPRDAAGGRGSSVTPPAPFSEAGTGECLAWGVDSLDVGLSVTWGRFWPQLAVLFDQAKNDAAGTAGKPSKDGRCLMLPSGKNPFRWHLQYPGFHLFLGKADRPHGETPNALASINSETLWRYGVEQAVALVAAEVEWYGGTLEGVKPSRCDLAADFHVPGGLSLDYLLARRCPKHLKSKQYLNGDRLESFYQGADGAPLLCRIYDKGAEVLVEGVKLWFREVWKGREIREIWRVEFQVRREVLKELGIDTVPDLLAKQAAFWTYLTRDWFTLREPDNKNPSRRTVSPFWRAVQASVGAAAARGLVRGGPDDHPADASWYVSHTAGCLTGYAARKALDAADAAADALAADIKAYWRTRDFPTAYVRQRIALGRPAGLVLADPGIADAA